MRKIHLAILAGITFVIAAGQGTALGAIIYSDDYDDLSQLSLVFGAAAAATDTETDSRTVLVHDGLNGAPPWNNVTEIQKAFSPALSLDGNPDGLISFTVDTVIRRNQSVYPPRTIFFDFRNDGNSEDEFQRLTIQVQSNTGGTAIGEYRGVDKPVANHFGGLLNPHFPHTVSASDYSTLRLKYLYATSQFTVSTIIGGTSNTVATFSLDNPTGAEFDRMRYRFEGSASAGPADSGWFIDSTLICTDDDCALPPEPGVLITAGLVNDVTGFMFDSGVGTNYQLECSTDGTNWTGANVTIHGAGQTETTFDPNGYDSNKTYRIVVVP